MGNIIPTNIVFSVFYELMVWLLCVFRLFIINYYWGPHWSKVLFIFDWGTRVRTSQLIHFENKFLTFSFNSNLSSGHFDSTLMLSDIIKYLLLYLYIFFFLFFILIYIVIMLYIIWKWKFSPQSLCCLSVFIFFYVYLQNVLFLYWYIYFLRNVLCVIL